MALKDIQLATISAVDRDAGLFDVDVYTEDGMTHASFRCSSETNALRLRSALRENADRLRRVADYNYRGPLRVRDERIAELEAALRSIIEEAGPQFGNDDPPVGTIDRIAFTARRALEK